MFNARKRKKGKGNQNQGGVAIEGYMYRGKGQQEALSSLLGGTGGGKKGGGGKMTMAIRPARQAAQKTYIGGEKCGRVPHNPFMEF